LLRSSEPAVRQPKTSKPAASGTTIKDRSVRMLTLKGIPLFT
jgi:hypothetical protein